MKKEDIEKIHPNAEARMFNPEFKVVVEKRSYNEGEEGEELEYKMIEGVGAVMGVYTDMGWYREKINANAFANCDMTNVVSLFNHDSNMLLSRTTGKQEDLTLMIENNQLKYKYEIKNDCAEKVAENIGLGFITGSSFMFRVKTDSWSTGADGVDEREILEIEKEGSEKKFEIKEKDFLIDLDSVKENFKQKVIALSPEFEPLISNLKKSTSIDYGFGLSL